MESVQMGKNGPKAGAYFLVLFRPFIPELNFVR